LGTTAYIKPKGPNRTQAASAFCNFNFEWASIPHDRDSSIDDEDFSLFDSNSESEFGYVEFDAASENTKAINVGPSSTCIDPVVFEPAESLTDEISNAAREFTLFPQLPPEIRDMVWK
jgi:hypothetical protein